jgi:hypothetical protein
LIHEAGHEVEVYYNTLHLIPRWFREGTKNMQAWAGDYRNQGFLFALIRGEDIERLDKKKFDGGPDYPHATLFCDYVNEASGGKLAKGWVEIERRVGRNGLTFEQAFEEVIGYPLQHLMGQFYDQLIPIAIQSIDRIMELEYEREAIQKVTDVDVSEMSVDELRNVLREALRRKIIIAPSKNLRDTATSI